MLYNLYIIFCKVLFNFKILSVSVQIILTFFTKHVLKFKYPSQ